MHRSLLRTTPLLAAVALTTACATSTPPPSGPSPVWGRVCNQGRPVLVVRNESPYSVQVVESRIGSGRRDVVAELGPGRHEVHVRNEPGYSYRVERLGGGAVRASTSRASLRAQAISLERECRPS